ncbi:hypothetical protein J0X19_22450 [Hymenobacter sp. BT186]|uniref:Uncharacterized protein n=1 Tax=Hymenobacter telluris TaxID=2816474 RepID=A0A939F0S4_9BACT|nr:hypothetical protein [Hymenobacter telluris]MBO0360739.1 hypothetical protein [Hymenobacter telluris]MBW3376767.1 hypothetical protein [Hymenobacter norwichensis]
MRRLYGALLLALAGCATSRPVPPLLRPPNLDSLERVAQLPAYLVPPPAQASVKQVAA